MNDEGDNPHSAMTPAQRDALLMKIDRALSGDPYNQAEHPGALTILMELHKDYYGDKSTRRLGTKDMVLKLWDNNRKVLGGMVVLGMMGSFLGWVLQKLVFGH
jgi:hypothetical protein